MTSVVALSAGCGGGDGPKTSTSPGTPQSSLTGPGTDQSENLSTGEKFIQALAANTAESLAEARTLTAPRSGAAKYVADAQAALSGTTQPRTMTELAQGRYRFCAGTDCSVVADLVLLDGRISTFKVDGKQLR